MAALTASVVDLGPSARSITIPAGASLVAALDDAISTDSATPGQTVVLRTVEPLVLGDASSLPAGLLVRGEITVAKEGGRGAGAPEPAINFTELEVEGQTYPIEAEPFRVRGKNDAAQRLHITLSRPVTVRYSGKSGSGKP